MGSLGDELSLGSMPITICEFPRKFEKLDEHVKKLEEEKRKIESCELELPLCLEILNNAISYLKEEYKRCSEMDDDTKPLLKDFISLTKGEEDDKRDELMREKKKFHQWRANDHITNQIFSEIEEESSNGLSMLLIPGMRIPKVETGLGLGLTRFTSMPQSPPPQPPPFLQQQALRKRRRSWTPELHRRFVDALQHLGGSGVATPKQIRDHMQEEGLTNDEVKSHLQKYRLHMRKPNPNPEKESLLLKLWNSSREEVERGGESSKRNDSQSGSPQGPLQLPSTTTTTTGGDSTIEDAEDSKSESFHMEKRLRSP